MAAKLFVGGLSWDTTEEQLQEFFAKIGSVVSATIIKDRMTGKSKGFGFVEMSTDEEAQKAIEELDGKTLDNRTIVVNKARPKAPRDNFRGGGGSFNRGDNRRGGDKQGGDRF